MKETVGFIGLGVMGRPMARNLSSRYPVVAYDSDKGRLEGLEGVTAASSVAEIVRRSGTILLSLPHTEAVSAVVEGPGGVLASMEPGKRLVDLSTTAPEITQGIAVKLAEKGCGMLDAPVSGGEAGAEAASLSIMCGGPAGLFEELKPLLETMGTTVVRVGENGAGQVAKLANNMIVGAAFTSAAEAFALAATAGIDPATLHKAIRGGWAGSPVLDVTAKAVTAGDYTPGGTVDLLSKDLGYARDLARSRKLPIPVTAIVDEVFTAAKARGDGGKAQPVIMEMWEALTGVQVSGKEKQDED